MDFDFYNDEHLQSAHLFMVKRICRVCGVEKDLVTDFYKCRKDPTLESSYAYECKSCAIVRNKNNYYRKRMDKMDTQGMSYGGCKSTKSLEEQRAEISPVIPNKVNIITDALKVELKELINEVLDERETEKKLNGPYDFPEV